MATCVNCSTREAQEGRELCFSCKLRLGPPGFSLRGGAKVGSSSFHTTKTDWLREHMGTESEKQLAKRTDIEKV